MRRLHEDGYDGPATLREYPGLTEAEIAAAVEFYQKAKTARDACVSLRRSIQTASNDDYSKALTEKRRRHVARLAAMEAAIEEIKRLRTALEVIAGGDGDAQVIARQTLEAAA